MIGRIVALDNVRHRRATHILHAVRREVEEGEYSIWILAHRSLRITLFLRRLQVDTHPPAVDAGKVEGVHPGSFILSYAVSAAPVVIEDVNVGAPAPTEPVAVVTPTEPVRARPGPQRVAAIQSTHDVVSRGAVHNILVIGTHAQDARSVGTVYGRSQSHPA